jgi:hypothetical protein
LTRKRRRLLTIVLLLAAAGLAAAIALVAIDGARYVAERSCGLIEVESEAKFHDDVAFLYGLWALPLALLMWAAVRVWITPQDGVEQGAAEPTLSQ